MRVMRVLLYAFMAAVLAAGWAFLYWQSSAVDLAAGNAARAALNNLRAVDARWNDQLVGARLASAAGAPLAPARHGVAYAELEVQALKLPHPQMGLALAGVKSAFAEKAALLARIRAGEPQFDQAWLVPTGPRLEQLSRVLDRAYEDALLHNELYRVWLLYYSAFLLTVLAYLAYELYRANAGLERRVAERTGELSEAMEKLKQSELMLVQSEKMSALGQMVAGLAHEVNTPLAYVKASLDAVRARAGESARLAEEIARLLELLAAEQADEARLAAQFETVKHLADTSKAKDLGARLDDGLHGIERIAELVANLKNFSRLDRSKVAAYDLHEGVESTLRIARQQLGARTVNKSLGNIPLVSCAPSQINQVLLNLLVNAAHATKEQGGVIGIRTQVRDDKWVAIDVADNGHGIAPEVLPKIFDPFFTTKEVGKGTGLGLSISYKIAQDHGGRLEVQSRPGAGTRFTLLLPWQESAST
jgi:two-component system, NtrC family, sensor kinase